MKIRTLRQNTQKKASYRVEKGGGARGWWRRESMQSGPEALETWVMASNLPGGSLVQSINGNSRKTAASLAHPGLGYALLEFDGMWQRLLCLAPAWTSLSSTFLTWHTQWKSECKLIYIYKVTCLVSEISLWDVRMCYRKQVMECFLTRNSSRKQAALFFHSKCNLYLLK